MRKNVAILASGSGSNAENIIRFFRENKDSKDDREVCFPVIVSNKEDAYVHERAKNLGVSSCTFKKSDFENGKVLEFLKEQQIDFIILAGFLLKVPENLLQAYPNKIINIHPALLPKFGGKGMYGSHVHEAVVAAKEKESGITIHYVNENYDEGQIIFQAKCEVLPTDTPDDVAEKVHALEYEFFPKVIAQQLLKFRDNVINKMRNKRSFISSVFLIKCYFLSGRKDIRLKLKYKKLSKFFRKNYTKINPLYYKSLVKLLITYIFVNKL